MSRSIVKIGVLALYYIVCISCNSKPKPVFGDFAKTPATVNGKKDSVSNNSLKKHGNATVAGPCVKCLIKVVQNTADYKSAIVGIPINNISYAVNWAEGIKTGDTTNTSSDTYALKLDIIEKGGVNTNIASFIFDNSLSELFLVIDNHNTEVKIDSVSLKKIRSKCYRRVALSK